MKFLEQLDQVLFEDKNWNEVHEQLKYAFERKTPYGLDFSPLRMKMGGRGRELAEFGFELFEKEYDEIFINIAVYKNHIHIEVYSVEYMSIMGKRYESQQPLEIMIGKYGSSEVLDREKFDIDDEMTIDHITDISIRLAEAQRRYRDTMDYGKSDEIS